MSPLDSISSFRTSRFYSSSWLGISFGSGGIEAMISVYAPPHPVESKGDTTGKGNWPVGYRRRLSMSAYCTGNEHRQRHRDTSNDITCVFRLVPILKGTSEGFLASAPRIAIFTTTYETDKNQCECRGVCIPLPPPPQSAHPPQTHD